jgi:hypothetical protein
MNEARIFIEGLLPDEINLITNGDLRKRIIDGWNVLDEFHDSYVQVYTTISTGDIQYFATDSEQATIRVEQTANIQSGPTYSGKIFITNATGTAKVRMVIGTNFSDWFSTVGEHTFTITSDATTFYLEFDNVISSPATAGYATMDINFVALYAASDNNQLDVGDIGLELQKGIDDITDITRVTSNFSLDFPIPGSERNNKILKQYYELDASDSYDPTKGLKCYLVVSSIEIYHGTLKLNGLTKDECGKLISYNVNFNGSLFSLMSVWGDTYLNELDYSEFNHDLFGPNTIESWSNNILVNGVPSVQPMGVGYIYVPIDNGHVNWSGSSKLGITDPCIPLGKIYPGMYAKQYLDKIFDFAGCTYESDFFDSDFFRRLVIPFNGRDIMLTQEQINERLYQASVDNTYTQSIIEFEVQNESELTEFGKYNNDSTGGNFDTSGGYNTTNFQWTAQNSGYYNFKASLGMRWRMTINDALPPNATAGFFSTTKATHVRLQLRRQLAPSSILLYESEPIEIQKHTGAVTLGTTLGTVNNLEMFADNIKLLAGETVYIAVKYIVEQDEDTAVLYNSNGNGYSIASLYYWRQDLSPSATDVPTEYNNGDLEMQFETGGIFANEVVNSGILEGDPIDMNAAAVRDLSIKDFFISLSKMFFLTVIPDKDNPKKFYIEPYVDYVSNDVVNWDQKRDKTKQQTHEPLGNLNAKDFIFKYANDSDYFNEHYLSERSPNGLNFGSRKIPIENDFLVGENTTEIAFAPTIVVDEHPGRVIFPSIFDQDRKPMQSVPRILHFSGFVTGEPWYIVSNTAGTLISNNPVFTMDNAKYAPTQSIVFGMQGTSYYWNNPNRTVPYVATNNNLYNKYYSKYVADITDKDSRKVKDWFYLSAKDIYNLDFSKLYFWSGYYFRLLRVYYNPLSEGSTKCEFLKTKDNPVFAPVTTDVGGGVWVGDTVGIGGTLEQNPGRDSFGFIGSNALPTGAPPQPSNQEDNYVGDKCINTNIVSSNECRVFESTNVHLTNCNNVTVAAGVNDVVAINCIDLHITESGTYISGVLIKDGISLVAIPCPGSNPYGSLIQKTCAEIEELIDEASSPAGCGLMVGQFYLITNVGDGDGTNGNGCGIVLQAIKRNKLSLHGYGIFLNPDFQGVGTYVFTGMVTGVNLGIWYATMAAPNVGDIVIWKNKHYVSITGTVGSEPDTDFVNYYQTPPTTEWGYIQEIDYVEFDTTICKIVRRRDKRGNDISFNEIEPSQYQQFQWGNDTCFSNTYQSSYNHIINCNSRAIEFSNNTMSGNYIEVDETFEHNFIGNNINGPTVRLINLAASGEFQINVLQGPFNVNGILFSHKIITPESSNLVLDLDLDTHLGGTLLTIPPDERYVAGTFRLLSSNATETIEKIIDLWDKGRPTKFITSTGLQPTFQLTPIGSAVDDNIVGPGSNVTLNCYTVSSIEVSDSITIFKDNPSSVNIKINENIIV